MTNPWMIEVADVPLETLGKARNQCGASDSAFLRSRSAFIAALGSGRDMKALFGFVPPTMLSSKAVLWMAVYGDLSLGEAKGMRRVLPALVKLLGYTRVVMEVAKGHDTDARFAGFLGFTPELTLNDRIVYGRNF